ncbi:MAG: cation transporter [Chloroflexi bacterium]|nr:cation transporter [Chloroflexota bacterium]
MFSTKSGAAKLSLIIVIALVVLKAVVAAITGSLSIIAQATDSFLDIVAVATTFFAVRIASKPADEEHPFGHGKMENIAAVGQALLIFAAGGVIIYSAVSRMITGATIEMTEAGMAVMVVSIIASIFLSRHLRKVARTTDSIALEANAHNIATDVYSAAAVLAGLIVIRFSGLNIIDSVIALAVAVIILKVGYDVVKKSFGGLVDVKLPETEENAIRASVTKYSDKLIDFHELRTRKAGSHRYIDLHLVMSKYASVEEAHKICDDVEQDIKSQLSDISVIIHVEPCDEECEKCPIPPDKRHEKTSR